MINVNALYIALVEPETVTIRPGQDPSDMFIFAPDYDVILKNGIEYDIN